MLFWIFLFVFAVALVGAILIDDIYTAHTFCCVVSVFVGIVVVIMTIVILINHVGVDGTIASNNQLYESLVYQYENNFYDNDNDVGKKELMQEIQEWNTKLAFYKETQRDLWIGIFIPDIYDQLEFIPLDSKKE